MQQPVLQTLGSWLAVAYFAYGIVVIACGVFALHAIVLLCALSISRHARWASGRFSRSVLLLELLYGLVNPLIYLTVLARVPGAPWGPTPAWLSAPAWVLLVVLWGTRLIGRHPDQDPEGFRRAVRLTLAASAMLLIAYLAKDLTAIATSFARLPPNGPAGGNFLVFAPLWILAWLCLYQTPLTLLLAHLRSTATPAAWNAERRFLLGNRRGARPLALSVIGLVGVSAVVSAVPASDDFARSLVLARRAPIVAAAHQQQIDPRLLASLLYVVQRDTVSALSSSLERVAMGAWLADPQNDFALAGPLDASIGLTQVKPSTALQAMSLYLSSTEPETWRRWRWDKTLRPLPALGPEWSLDAGAVASLAPPFTPPPSKPDVVESLFTDDGSLSTAAFILALYEAQWRSADPAWDISTKPEITATLYQIGFARSHPHADPRANEFGAAVGRVYRSPWMQEHFGVATDAQRSPRSE